MSSLAIELPNEINRVRGIQDQYKELIGMPGVNVRPGIVLMELAITNAIKASSTGDVIEMMKAYTELQEITGSPSRG